MQFHQKPVAVDVRRLRCPREKSESPHVDDYGVLVSRCSILDIFTSYEFFTW
jgi:hypothetical protein